MEGGWGGRIEPCPGGHVCACIHRDILEADSCACQLLAVISRTKALRRCHYNLSSRPRQLSPGKHPQFLNSSSEVWLVEDATENAP